MSCRHCKVGVVARPRGLCWKCYYTPNIRDAYPSTSKFAAKGLHNFCGDLLPPPEPTNAMPGTAAKVEALIQRAKQGFGLWHPGDNEFVWKRSS